MERLAASGRRPLLIVVLMLIVVLRTNTQNCFLDLNFVVDSSGSINFKGPNNWDTTLEFIANVSQQFHIGPNDVQVAFVLFSDIAIVEWGLTRYQEINSLLNAISNVRYLGESTNLNDALYLTWSYVFAPGRGTRYGAAKITVVLTDGEDNVPTTGTPLTLQNATRCKNEGIRLLAIGVSESVDANRLLQIVSHHDDYYPVVDFDYLYNIGLVSKLQTIACTSTTTFYPDISTGKSTLMVTSSHPSNRGTSAIGKPEQSSSLSEQTIIILACVVSAAVIIIIISIIIAIIVVFKRRRVGDNSDRQQSTIQQTDSESLSTSYSSINPALRTVSHYDRMSAGHDGQQGSMNDCSYEELYEHVDTSTAVTSTPLYNNVNDL